MAKHTDIAQDKPLIKKMAKQEVKAHEKRMHKMAKGGVTNEALKTLGRNMARSKNQGGK
jgi:hypothetical protein